MKEQVLLPTGNTSDLFNELGKGQFLIRNTVPNICVRDKDICNGKISLIAGPCSVENESMLHETSVKLKQEGINFLRGGAYKPSTSPYGFQGLGKVALKWLKEVKDAYDIGIVTEILSINHLEDILGCADIIQVGTRNMNNYELLKELGGCNQPILLKRGMSAKVEEWLLAAEYIVKGGNDKVIFCERGIRTFETYTRNTLDLSMVPVIKELTSFPIIIDPSHGTGRRSLVGSMSLAALAAGADGLIIEVHPNPNQALKDGAQSIDFKGFSKLMDEIKKLGSFLNKPVQ